MPFNIDVNDHLLNYATVQPLYILQNKIPTYVFLSHPGTASELLFSADNLKKVTLDGKKIKKTNSAFALNCEPEKEHLIQLTATDGKQTKILLLTQEQARQSWKIQHGDEEFVCITSSQVIPSAEDITIRNVDKNQYEISIYPANARWEVKDGMSVKKQKKGDFLTVRFETPAVSLEATYQKEQNPESFIPSQPLYPEDNRRDNVPANCPGPQYFVNFKPVPSSLYYTINTPKLPASMKNAYMMIDYVGDTGSLYDKGALIADDYYWGGPMIFDLGRMEQKDIQEYLLQIIPFTPEVKIYLDPSVRKNLQLSLQGIRSVRVLPVYDMKLTLAK